MSGNYFFCCLLGLSAFFFTATVAREGILHGANAINHQFPYQVSLQNEDHHHICGAGFIRDQYLLTAAHCVVDKDDRFIRGLNVLANTINLRITSSQQPAVRIAVKEVSVPKEYDAKTGNADIAVLKLRGSLVHPIRPYTTHWLRLSTHNHQNYADDRAMVAGFGWNNAKVNNGKLRFAVVKILSDKACSQDHLTDKLNFEKQLCAKFQPLHYSHLRNPIGACYGDGGSLLVLENHYQDVNATVVGVLSKVAPSCDERYQSAIYTSVSHYHKFIEDAIVGNLHNIRTN